MTRLRGGGATDVGRVRSHNEDQFLTEEGKHLYAVADGVGGHKAGEVASQTAVDTLRSAFAEPTTDGLVGAVKEANRTVWNLAESNRDQRGMGTTLTAIALVQGDGEDEEGGDRLAVVNVGDSRAYLLHDGELEQVTEDHSLVEQLVREGQLTHEEALVHPQRSIITRALGLDPDVEVDSWELIPYRGDRVLLCSDGLTNEVRDDDIAKTLRSIADPEEAARTLVTQARDHGGNDNITCVVVDVVDDGDRAEQASAALADEPAGRTTLSARSARETQDAPLDTDGGRRPLARSRAETQPPPRAARPAPTAEPLRAKPRRFTWRVVVFVIALVLLLAAVVAAVGWYARGTYYVGLDNDRRVAIFKGRPGGLLWFEPTFVKGSQITEDQIPAADRANVRKGHEEPSLADADRYVTLLRQRATPTTTTVPPPPAQPPGAPPTSIP